MFSNGVYPDKLWILYKIRDEKYTEVVKRKAQF